MAIASAGAAPTRRAVAINQPDAIPTNQAARLQYVPPDGRAAQHVALGAARSGDAIRGSYA